ncbi:molecular chaperone Tir [Pseudomonas sp. NPDC089996]|uniref:molecular chaperone Tir n=1 Tax=Pseudomonas sp. NPDC089996 TaxID=3364474 RepID=UPI0038081DA5
MPVFISYRHEERLDAFILNERLLLEGITAQLVEFGVDGQDAQGRACQQLNDATHWIGLLPAEADDDWWTVRLLETAVTANLRVSFYRNGDCELPKQLDRWPVMRERAHIDLFVRAYHDECTFQRAMTLPAERGSSVDRDNADYFHADLKAKIRRGF